MSNPRVPPGDALRLRMLAFAAGVSETAIADRLGLTRSNICDAMAGRRRVRPKMYAAIYSIALERERAKADAEAAARERTKASE